MKTRNSLVSNSSSASFVILWKRIRDSGEVDKNLDDVFHGLNYDLSDVEKIKRASEMLADGIVRTKFWTGMMNNYADFGIEALELFTMVTITKSGFILISADVDSDNC
jgi:hypothetical protein